MSVLSSLIHKGLSSIAVSLFKPKSLRKLGHLESFVHFHKSFGER